MSGFDELHEELRRVARQVLGAAAGRVEGGDPVVVDRAVLAEAGWLGLEVPEDLGGAGATVAETAVVLEELGRVGAVAPFLGSAVLGVGALLAAGPSARRDGLLAAIAAGEVTVAVALPADDVAVAWLGGPAAATAGIDAAGSGGATAAIDQIDAAGGSGEVTAAGPSRGAGRAPEVAAGGEGRPHEPRSPTERQPVTRTAALPFRLACDGARLAVDGAAAFVPDAPDADVLLLLALDPDGVPVLVAVDRPAAAPPAATGAAGLDVAATPVLDGRSFATVTSRSLRVGDDDVLRFGGDPHAAVAHLVGRGALATAIDSLGAAQAMLEATVAYTKERRQFDRPIGSFQAVKHQLADGLVQLTLARELVAAAVTDPTDGRATAMAKAHTTSIAVDVAGTAMQLHGGIGYTWESGVHAALKRLALNRSLFGSPTAHRRLLAATIRPATM